MPAFKLLGDAGKNLPKDLREFIKNYKRIRKKKKKVIKRDRPDRGGRIDRTINPEHL
jgi:hypothetical protein